MARSDAALKGIERATGVDVVLRKFEVRSVSAGRRRQGEALVYVEYNQRTYRGSSVSTNIVESATQAFLEVINRIDSHKARSRAHVLRRPCNFSELLHAHTRQRSTSGSTASCPVGKPRCTCCRTRCITASSVFEGVRAYETPRGPAIFRLRDHTKRLFDSARSTASTFHSPKSRSTTRSVK
jgi:hypothetical protein